MRKTLEFKPKRLTFDSYEEFLNDPKRDKHPMAGVIDILKAPKTYEETVEEQYAIIKGLPGGVRIDRLPNKDELYDDILKVRMPKFTKLSQHSKKIMSTKSMEFDQHPNVNFHCHLYRNKEFVVIIENQNYKGMTREDEVLAFLYADKEFVQYMFVHEKYRGKKYGEAMYLLAIAYFKNLKHDCKSIMLGSLGLLCKIYFNTDYQEVIRINNERMNK